MSTTFDDKDRRVIPRWRPFLITRAIGELAPTALKEFEPDNQTESFRQLKLDWTERKSLHFATDLVGAALVSGAPLEAKDAAEFILVQGEKASAAARSLANCLLGILRPQDVATPWAVRANIKQPEPCQIVRDSRILIHQDPRNAFAWVDLALGYESLGLMDRAKQAMRAALSLAPHDRFVLRSAVRLFIHQESPDEAYQLLARNSATVADPWLIAAEVAIAPIAGKSPKLYRPGLRLIERGSVAPFHLSELSAAIATLDFKAGDYKRGRKLIATSLRSPTENALAQASWASRQFGGIELSAFALGYVPWSFEANTLENFHAKNWDGAIAAAQHWLRDQPFSSRPAVMGSFVTAVATADFAKSESFARAGLIANPHDVLLQNNLAFALANSGKPDEATAVLSRISGEGLEPNQAGIVLATHGLIAFRRGLFEEGRQYYRTVIDGFSKRREKTLAASASLYYALEELRCGSPDAVQTARAAVDNAATFTTDPGLEAIRSRVQAALEIPPGWLTDDRSPPST